MRNILLLSALLFGTADAASQPSKQTFNLRILETSDLHTSALGYDYYQDKPTGEFGLAYTATLIEQARKEKRNALLFDNGDLIQGNPLGDYVAKIEPLKEGELHPMHAAMKPLRYNAATLGNHEFNYGLPFLQRVLKNAPMPIVSANVYRDNGKGEPSQRAFKPYTIQRHIVFDEKGIPAAIRVGIIGLVTPQITDWDKAALQGKIVTTDAYKEAQKLVPEMKEKGADIIIVLAHGGLNREITERQENFAASMTTIPGVDVVLSGHSHQEFPGNNYKTLPNVDIAKGTMNGKPVTMPGFWGNHLGVTDLSLSFDRDNGKWQILDTQASVRPIWDKTNKKSLVEADPRIIEAVKERHEGTLQYIRSKVADLSAPITSYWALIQDDPSIQLVAAAQADYVKKALADTQYKDLPVLSAAAPFKAGGRAGASYYTDIPAGTLAIKNVADLYVYPNTVQAVLLKGNEVQEWLERSAGIFKQIDPNKTDPQALIDESFPTYNYDVIDGIAYDIDITQPSKYDSKGNIINTTANRIKNLRYQGKPIDPNAQFVVATNNYRASGGGAFPNLNGQNIILQAPDETRQALLSYFQSQGTVNPTADNNWKLVPIRGVTLSIASSPNAQKILPNNVSYVKTREDGFAEYELKW